VTKIKESEAGTSEEKCLGQHMVQGEGWWLVELDSGIVLSV